MNPSAIYKAIPRRNVVKKERIVEIDFLRGFDLILMMLVHLIFQWGSASKGLFLWNSALGPEPTWIVSMRNLFDLITNLILGGSLYFLEFFFSGLFVFLSGIACTFSRSNAKRAAELGIVALSITFLIELADYLFHIGAHIYLGILHSLAIGIGMYAIVDYFSQDWRVTFGAGILFVLLTGITEYYRVKLSSPYVSFPTDAEDWLSFLPCFLGIKRTGSDYFSPMRICSLIFLGATVGKVAYKERKSHWPKRIPSNWTKPFCFLGRHSLLVYVIHIPIVMLLLAVLLLSAGYRLAFLI